MSLGMFITMLSPRLCRLARIIASMWPLLPEKIS
jgi:hypothetical protein